MKVGDVVIINKSCDAVARELRGKLAIIELIDGSGVLVRLPYNGWHIIQSIYTFDVEVME